MASPRPLSASSPSFNDLPLELVERVVELAGRGIEALSRTNKNLRALCLPYLCQTVKAKHFEGFFFLYNVVKSPLASCIICLNLTKADEDQVLATSSVLRLLPKLDTIVQSYYHFATKLLLDKMDSLSVELDSDDDDSNGYRSLELFAERGQLRCLNISSYNAGEVDEYSEQLQTVWSRLPLVKLEVHSSYTYPSNPPSASWISTAVLSRVTSLVYDLTCRLAHIGYDLELFAPNLISLTLTNVTFTLSWYPAIPQLDEDMVFGKESSFDYQNSRRKRTIDEVLEWAKQRAEEMCEARDQVGLEQLGRSLIRTRQLEGWMRQ
ncbi:hypothetical protein JCM8547_005242 [Rhodosporidiobolus lusitaniae]